MSWLDDVEGADASADDGGGDDATTTLFADNFRGMVEDGDVESLNVQTIEAQIGDIDDPELLAAAIDADSREATASVYQDRIAAINQQTAQDDAPQEPSEPDLQDEASDPADETAGGDDGGDPPDDAGGLDGDDAGTAADDGPGVDAAQDTESAAASGAEGQDTAPDDETSSEGATRPPQTHSEDASSEGLDVDVDVTGIAPDAAPRAAAAQREKERTLLVWGQEGTGKTHVAHTAPEPIAYIDTEGKADELAEKFDGKDVFYFQPDNYQQATDALDQALDLLAEYRGAGVTGTLAVDSLTKLWAWAKQDYAELAYPSADSHEEVDFQSALEGENDWTQIKRRHNTNFRDRIIQSPYHVVFTATAKEDYNAVIQGTDGKPMIPDGEKDNPYAVKEVVRLRVDDAGITVGDLHKAARVRRSFVGLTWPDWESIYGAIDRIADAEQAAQTVDVSSWDIDVVDGKPTYVSEAEEGDDAE
jgi:hypothetical protein